MKVRFIVELDAQASQEISTAVCSNFGYSPVDSEGNVNPVSPQQFVVDVVESWFRQQILTSKLIAAEASSRATATQETNALDINISLDVIPE